MALTHLRQRSGYLFTAVMLGHVILISAQVSSRSGVPVLEAVTFGLFAEVQRGVSAVVSGVRFGWAGYVSLRGVRAQNQRLESRLASAEIELQQQRALAARSRMLERLLALRDSTSLATAAASVIAAGATPDFQTVTIDKGRSDGLESDMAVIAPAGVVGRVVVPAWRAAKVQLLIDRNAAAGALIERSRAQGVIVGNDGRLRMEYVSEVSDVKTGDVVVTSGLDGIYPKGFVIGRVEQVERGASTYKTILVRPAVDFANLEDVLVVLTHTPTRAAVEETAR